MDGPGASTVNLVAIYVSTVASYPMALPCRQHVLDGTIARVRVSPNSGER